MSDELKKGQRVKVSFVIEAEVELLKDQTLIELIMDLNGEPRYEIESTENNMIVSTELVDADILTKIRV